MKHDLVVTGAGAAGCFAAIRLAEFHPGARIVILEAARKPLSKVEISGGGRCNVTHACFDPGTLCSYYPRGQKDLLEPFTEFQPADLINWFHQKGVRLKTEPDGRMFPVSDSSSTIIQCFQKLMTKYGIELLTSSRVVDVNFEKDHNVWMTRMSDGREFTSRNLLISSGSDQRIWNRLREMKLKIIDPVPSLFTFNILEPQLNSLKGISLENVEVSIPSVSMKANGPLLITHWGLSGPAILKLSAWAARELHECNYHFEIRVNWLGNHDQNKFAAYIRNLITKNPKKHIHNISAGDFPARLWQYLCSRSGIPAFTSGNEFGRKQMSRLMDTLTNDLYDVTGKSTFKEEFVTAGGVSLEEIDTATFGSRKFPGLFLAGEVLNIDALTGGFNFQAAWTAGHIVAKSIASGF